MKNRKSVVIAGVTAFVNETVGNNKTATFSGFSPGGEDAENYTLSAQQASVMAAISEKIQMIQISAETFRMGSPLAEQGRQTNETQHEVTLTKGFYMSKYPVVQAQYELVMGTNPGNFKSRVVLKACTANRPVEMVSWYDAIVFCNKLSMLEGLSPAYEMQTQENTAVWSTDPETWGTVPTSSITRWNAVRIVSGSDGYRLPTEAQWEFACRAGTTTAFNNGNNDYTNKTLVGEVAWYSGNSGSRTHAVGEKKVNDWGLYDMHGNVYEWCWDWYDANYGGIAGMAAIDPVGAPSGSGRVIRGGSWVIFSQNVRSAYRGFINPSFRDSYFGFRIIRP